MGLLICIACDRQREISPLHRLNYRCSNCGAKSPRIIHRRKWWKNWEENAGIIKIEAMRRAYAGLRWLQENKKFKPKYPDAKFKAIYGIWPPEEISQVPPYAPTANLLWWIERSNAAWKKAKRFEESHQEASPASNKKNAVIPGGPCEPAHNKEKAPEVVLWLPEPSIEPENVSFMTADDWNVKL